MVILYCDRSMSIYVCVYVCMYVCMYRCTVYYAEVSSKCKVCMYMCVCICVYVYVCVCVCVCVCVHMCSRKSSSAPLGSAWFESSGRFCALCEHRNYSIQRSSLSGDLGMISTFLRPHRHLPALRYPTSLPLHYR